MRRRDSIGGRNRAPWIKRKGDFCLVLVQRNCEISRSHHQGSHVTRMGRSLPCQSGALCCLFDGQRMTPEENEPQQTIIPPTILPKQSAVHLHSSLRSNRVLLFSFILNPDFISRAVSISMRADGRCVPYLDGVLYLFLRVNRRTRGTLPRSVTLSRKTERRVCAWLTTRRMDRRFTTSSTWCPCSTLGENL